MYNFGLVNTETDVLITVKNYPGTFYFWVRSAPTSDQQRTEIFRSYLRQYNVDSPNHDYDDYVVEDVTKSRSKEHWEIGS